VAAADDLARANGATIDTLYNCACACALAAGAVKDDAALGEKYASRAVGLLRQAVAAGYKDVEHIQQETDFDPLRGREDFQQVLKQLAAKASAQKSRP
jgi:hypothetical protein